jgi:hypothetical protein
MRYISYTGYVRLYNKIVTCKPVNLYIQVYKFTGYLKPKGKK